MKSIALLLLCIPTLVLAQSLKELILSAEKVLKLSNIYIENEKKIELSNYYVDGVSFDYLEKKTKEAKWTIFYLANPNKDGSIAIGEDQAWNEKATWNLGSIIIEAA